MSQRLLNKIREAILLGNYDLTRHAVDEMAEDGLNLFDVEMALLSGRVTKTETDDPRGTRYTVIGWSENQRTEIGVVGRFKETDVYLIITIYAVT